MAKLPPPVVVTVTDRARAGLDVVKRNLVPPPIAALDFVQNFWSFNVAFSFAELRVADALRDGQRAVADVAQELELHADALYRLLRAGTMLGLCEELPERVFALKPIGRALCTSDEASLRDFIVYMGRHGSRIWRRLPDCVRTGKTGVEIETGKQPWEYLTGEVGEDFNRAMTATSSITSEALIAVYDFSFATTIVDVGGGHGSLLATILQRATRARGVLFDQPNVVTGAGPVLEARGVAARVQVTGGNFFESVPSGDCYVLKTIIHDWDDDDARKILANIRKAMTPNGRVVLYEAIVGGRNVPSFAKFLDLEMLVAAGGRERTVEEYRTLFASAGLKLERTLATAGPMSIIEARAS